MRNSFIEMIGGCFVLARRRLLPRDMDNFQKYKSFFKDKNLLEAGGPSPIFSSEGQLPIYPLAKNVDGVNFSDNTIWEGTVKEGKTYKYDDKIGHQYIMEANDLKKIKSESYDGLITSHCLEHVADPLKAIEEWVRVIKSKGLLVIVVPRKEYTFDHRRDFTKFEHVQKDYKNKTKETDTTHFPEVIEKHNVFLDFTSGGFEKFVKRTKQNIKNRSVHQHVFSPELLTEMLETYDCKVLQTALIFPFHQIVIAQKP